MKLRPYDSADRAALTSLWQTVFGDEPAFIEDFLTNLARPGRGYAAEIDGVLAAAAYIIDGIQIDGTPWPYIYAVSTLPEYRGLGCGAAVSRACAELICREGGVPCLHPAERTLFDWYGKMGFAPAMRARQAFVSSPETAPISLTPLSPAQYAAVRREILDGHAFADFDPALLDWWQRGWKGRFYGFDGGCLAVCGRFVPELLARKNAGGALAAALESRSLVRTPALAGFAGFGDTHDCVAAIGAPATDGYFGFFFD